LEKHAGVVYGIEMS